VSELHVLLDDAEVGRVQETDAGLRFAYARAWLDTGYAISRSLPLREAPYDAEATRFFGNLLPEGGVRTAITRRLGLSEDHDFALLRAIGRECAGALRIVDAAGRRAKPGRPRPITADELAKWSRGGGYAAAVGEHLRLSLAGAQDKLGVVLVGDTLALPAGASPSTHLLKLPNRDFAALPQNEALVLALARRIGLPVVESRLLVARGPALLLVTRYDRTASPVRRRHQEDLCQALGVDRRRKYEADGGPSFARCVVLVRDHSVQPLPDVRALLRWLAFCVVVGNRDNHAKNLSLLRDDAGRWRLAPFYDLVCTTAYPRLAKRPGMAVGTRTDGGNLPRVAWETEARAVGVKAAYLVDVAADVAHATERELPAVTDEIATQLGDRTPLTAVVRAITKGVRAVQRGLA
jgi:serine/threonine-protein kinase HipA